jgi:hypothetical protein
MRWCSNSTANQNTVLVGDALSIVKKAFFVDRDDAFLDIHDNIMWLIRAVFYIGRERRLKQSLSGFTGRKRFHHNYERRKIDSENQLRDRNWVIFSSPRGFDAISILMTGRKRSPEISRIINRATRLPNFCRVKYAIHAQNTDSPAYVSLIKCDRIKRWVWPITKKTCW